MTRARLVRLFVAARAIAFALALAACGWSATDAHAFPVDPDGAVPQTSPAVASTPDGEFLVVWEADDRLRAQRYTPQGTAAGSALDVAEAPAESPAVTHLAGGGYLVVWAAADGATSVVLGRTLDDTGAPAGGPFAIAPGLPASQRAPAVAVNTKGRGLVTFTNGPFDSSDIWARRTRINGRPRGSELLVNAFTTGVQYGSRVASTRPARFVVVWASWADRDGSYGAVFGQRFRRTGRKVGTEFQVNTYTTGSQYSPDVAAGREASFVVVWNGGLSDEQGPLGYRGANSPGIRAQRFTRGARKLGTEFVASTFEYGPHADPQIDSDATGRFVVSWMQGDFYDYDFRLGRVSCGAIDGGPDESYVCADGSGTGVFRQVFDEHAEKIGGEVALTGFRDQLEPAVALSPAGRFVVAWNDADCARAENYACRYFGRESAIHAETGELAAPPASMATR